MIRDVGMMTGPIIIGAWLPAMQPGAQFMLIEGG